MRKFYTYLLSCVIALVVVGCGGSATTNHKGDLLYSPRYATGFEIRAIGEHSSVLTIKNPWQGAEGVEIDLFIGKDGELPPEGFVGSVMEAEPSKVVCMSSTYVALIDTLGFIGTVRGVSGAGYVSNPTIRTAHAEGRVADVGYDANVNYETIVAMQPDLVMIYGVAGDNSAMTTKLDDLGITHFYIGDYVENHPLGKAEWVVAMAEIYGCRERGEAIFEGIADKYEQLRTLATDATDKPSVMLNSPYRDTWFVPGDRSYLVTLLTDAGAEYVCAGNDSTVSRPISTETAYIYASRADYWLNPNQANTLDQLRAENPKFADIKAVREGNVYNCTARSTPEGGSDFWESGTLRADRVLADLIAIFHPDKAPDEGGYYFLRLR